MKTEIKARAPVARVPSTPAIQRVAYHSDIEVAAKQDGSSYHYISPGIAVNSNLIALDTAIASIPAQTNYAVTCAETTPEGYAKTYTFTQCGQTIATVNIPKDMVVSSGQVVDKESEGAWGPAGKYIELTLANATSDKVYIAVADLVDTYTAAQGAAQVQLAISNNNVISATIVASSVGTTELADGAVTTAKVAAKAITDAKLSDEVNADLALAHTALQSHQDISGKADKDTDAVTGNLAEFDANHNPVDSGKKVSDFALDGHSHAISDVTGLQSALNDKVDAVSGKGLSTEDYTTAEKTKLEGIAAGAEVNQNAFSNVKVGADTLAASGKTDTFELVAGDNVTLTADTATKKITIKAAATDITGKADRVSGATNGNFAGLDSNGNLTDSGKKASDFAEATHSHTADQVSGLATVATSGNYSDLTGAKSADGTTIQDSSNVFSVKDGGIGTAKLANGAVTEGKLAVLNSFQLVDQTSTTTSQYYHQKYTVTIVEGVLTVTPAGQIS